MANFVESLDGDWMTPLQKQNLSEQAYLKLQSALMRGNSNQERYCLCVLFREASASVLLLFEKQ